MEVKKSPKADLEKGKTMGILMGMIVGLAVLFVGFEWSDREITIVQSEGVADIIAEEEVEITRPEDTPPPPPPPPAPAVAEVLTVVEDDVKLDDVEIVSSEDGCRVERAHTGDAGQQRQQQYNHHSRPYRRTADQRTAVTTHVLGSLQVYGTRLLIHSAIRRCGAIEFSVTGMTSSPTPHSLMARMP